MGQLNLADWVDCTEVEGPGKRFALWVQGCTLRCHGCCNSNFFELTPKYIVESTEVLDWIKQSHIKHKIDGITLLGGEPMLQARGLAEIATGCQRLGLSVMVFTGYTIEYLNKCTMLGIQELLQVTDILVDGPYVAGQFDSKRNWAGSTNQRFHFLTKRYTPGIEWDSTFANGIEVRVYTDGTVRTNGWPYLFSKPMILGQVDATEAERIIF
jgi:anaerobic ribonucleoside-triphosphate reductase activating protein